MPNKKAPIISLNQKTIEALPTPREKNAIYYDEKEDKLYLLISPMGTKVFYLLSRVKYKVERIKIGRYPEVKVEKAREIARNLKANIMLGNTPLKDHIASKNITFKDAFDRYMEFSKKKHKSWKIDEYIINKHCKRFFNRKISTITHKELKDFIVEKSTESFNTANSLLKRVKGIFKRAIELELYFGENPTKNISSYPEVRRDRFIQPNELEDFFKVLKQQPENFQDIINLGLLTAARKSNLLSMEWSEIDFNADTWTIPAYKSKNGSPMVIPLVEEAKEILLKRKNWGYQQSLCALSKRKQKEYYEKLFKTYVFPSVRGTTGHLMNFAKKWNKFKKDFVKKRKEQHIENIENIRVHDLRRTMASFEALCGKYSLQVIGKSLGHKSTASTEIYARLMLNPVRASMETAVSLMKKQNYQD